MGKQRTTYNVVPKHPDIIAEIIADRETMSLKALCKKHKISANTAMVICGKKNIEIIVSDEDKAEMMEMRKQGIIYPEIGKRFGLKGTQVYCLVKKWLAKEATENIFNYSTMGMPFVLP